jgi:hypothetical protein
LNVHPVGMDERSQQTMRLFFERQLGGSCTLSGELDAHAVLIDLDGHRGSKLLAEQLRDHPDRPLLLLSLNEVDGFPTNAVLVRKPIKLDLLADALRELSARRFAARRETEFSSAAEHILRAHLAHRQDHAGVVRPMDADDVAALHLQSPSSFFHIGDVPDVDLSAPEQRARVFYEPDKFLQGHFRRALSQSTEWRATVRLSGAAFQHLDIDARSGRVLVPIAGSTLYAAGRLPMAPRDVTIELLEDAPHAFDRSVRSESAEALLWKLALWASKGRVPLGTDLDWPVYLKRWPNLPRLLAPPHATRISSLWVRNNFSLAGTAATLGIPQRLVFAFYSACVALELAAPTRRGADVLVPPEAPPASDKRGLFRSLLRKLMHDWSE